MQSLLSLADHSLEVELDDGDTVIRLESDLQNELSAELERLGIAELPVFPLLEKVRQ